MFHSMSALAMSQAAIDPEIGEVGFGLERGNKRGRPSHVMFQDRYLAGPR